MILCNMLSNSIYSHMFSYTNNYKIYPLEFMKLHTKFCTLNVYFKFNKPKSYEKIKKLKFYAKFNKFNNYCCVQLLFHFLFVIGYACST